MKRQHHEERVVERAKEIARTGRHIGWFYVASELQHERGEPLALQILEREPFRSEIDLICIEARKKKREHQKIVTRMPLRDLWRDAGLLDAHRHGTAGRDEIPKLLRDGSTFVVADVGHPLRWIPEQDRFTFWKAEVKAHLVPAKDNAFYLEAYPGEYCYVASVWHCVGVAPVIVLEKHH